MKTMTTLILNAEVVNEDIKEVMDIFIRDGIIDRVDKNLQHLRADEVVDASGLVLIPGMIDDQVHFREPGLTHKADISSESAAAVAGGVTSYMEMPNVIPPTINAQTLDEKFRLASKKSHANYSFYLGASNDNLEDIKKVDPARVCGVKIFMGASTGNLLVDDPSTLEAIFRSCPILIATHCENSTRVRENYKRIEKKYSGEIPMSEHPNIRDVDVCFTSSSYAVELARKYNSDLHVLHLTTKKEMDLFESGPIKKKKITAEACVHHLWFSDNDYERQGTLIKCNPAIKSKADREAIRDSLINDKIDVIATDHAPHTLNEKNDSYDKAPAGLPLVQHALPSLLELHKKGVFTLELIVKKTSHNPAIRYGVVDRGFIRPGFWADFVLIDMNYDSAGEQGKILSKCAWSPFAGVKFSTKIKATYVNGMRVFDGKSVRSDSLFARELHFSR